MSAPHVGCNIPPDILKIASEQAAAFCSPLADVRQASALMMLILTSAVAAICAKSSKLHLVFI